MKKLMYKIMLTCKQATFYSSIKSFRKLNLVHRIQLKLHLSMCKSCQEFDHQSQLIDQSMDSFYKNEQNISEENLSEEKKSQIKATVNQYINQE